MDARLLMARQAVLAVSVLDDVDVSPVDDGVALAGGRRLTWYEVAELAGDTEPASDSSRLRLAGYLTALATLPTDAAALTGVLLEHGQVMGLPLGHLLVPTSDWVLREVPGGVLGVGLGVRLPGRPAVPLAARWVGADVVHEVWPQLEERLSTAANLAAHLPRHDHGAVLGAEVFDAFTLLATVELREALVQHDRTGLVTVCAPDRRRLWCDERRVDRSFVAAAYAATAPADQALPEPLLVSRDAVTVPASRPPARRPR